jgi:hypothetical protein
MSDEIELTGDALQHALREAFERLCRANAPQDPPVVDGSEDRGGGEAAAVGRLE